MNLCRSNALSNLHILNCHRCHRCHECRRPLHAIARWRLTLGEESFNLSSQRSPGAGTDFVHRKLCCRRIAVCCAWADGGGDRDLYRCEETLVVRYPVSHAYCDLERELAEGSPRAGLAARSSGDGARDSRFKLIFEWRLSPELRGLNS